MTATGKKKYHGFTVTYNTDNHISVLTQMWGSIWPKVLPFCILNTLLAIALDVLKIHAGIDLAISVSAHKFFSLIVAFLLVSRANVAIGKYNEARGYLSDIFKSSRELLQNLMVYSSKNTDSSAKEWRYHVTHRTMLLLRCSMAVLNYSHSQLPAWELPELSEEERGRIKRQIYFENEEGGEHLRFSMHHYRSTMEENMRVPILMAFQLRRAVHSQNRTLKTPLTLAEENKLLGSVDGIMSSYYSMRKFLTTPFPFPLVQMARTFLFFYVFTVPFALLSDDTYPLAHYLVIWSLTFGFMGIEHVSIALDDPFGDDDTDFANLRLMYSSFEENYTCIRDMDGEEYVDRLRKAMHVPTDEPLSPEQQWLEE